MYHNMSPYEAAGNYMRDVLFYYYMNNALALELTGRDLYDNYGAIAVLHAVVRYRSKNSPFDCTQTTATHDQHGVRKSINNGGLLINIGYNLFTCITLECYGTDVIGRNASLSAHGLVLDNSATSRLRFGLVRRGVVGLVCSDITVEGSSIGTECFVNTGKKSDDVTSVVHARVQDVVDGVPRVVTLVNSTDDLLRHDVNTECKEIYLQ